MLQADIKALQAELESLVTSLEDDSSAFSTAFSQAALAQQEATQQAEEAAAEALAMQLMQQLREKRQALTQQQTSAKALKQHVLDSQAALGDVKQLIAAESAASSELMAQLQEAESEGSTAQQLAGLRQELAEREEALLQQKCRWVTPLTPQDGCTVGNSSG